MGKGGGSSSGTQTVKNEPPKYLVPHLTFATEQARKMYDAGAPKLYPDQMYTPMNAMQDEALQQTLSMAREGSPLVSAGQSYLQNVLGEADGSNPQLDALMDRYGKKANAIVAGNFNMAGRTGSAANAATAAREVTDSTLPYLLEQYNADRQAKMQAAGMAPTMAQYDFDNASRIGAVGDVYQGYDQQDLQEQMLRWDYANGGAEKANLDEFMARVNGMTASAGNRQTTSSTGGGGGVGSTIGGIVSGLGTLGGMGNGLASFLGGGSGLAGMLGGSAGGLGTALSFLGFSDRRLKENVHWVGVENGHRVYSFNYKCRPERFIGVMADEVEKTHPAAVREVHGFKAVDYAMIGVRMREVGGGSLDSPPERAAAPVSRGGTVETGAAGCKEGGA